jgi:hypothetical protein
MSARVLWAVLVAAVVPATAAGQDLARRVSAVEDGTVRLSYATREGVEICAQGIRMGEHHVWWRSGDWEDEGVDCRVGSAEVELRVRDGLVRDIEILRRVRDRTTGATDLGTVPAEESARYFLALARGDGATRGDEDFILPAYLADVEEVWRDLLAVAKDREVRRGVRSSALFWVGQEAADAATEGLAEVAFDEDEEQDVRDAAIFALSQRPNDEAVPLLMDLARTAEQAKTRKTAMFWLAQSKDDRVLAFFEEILLGRGGG